MVPHAHASNSPSLNVLNLLQFDDCIFGYSSEQGIVEVQPRCHKGEDNPFTRVSVQKPPDSATILNVVPRRLRYSIHMGDHGLLVSNTARRSLTDVTGAMRESTTITPDSEVFFSCCREPISSTSVLPSFSLRKLHLIQVQVSSLQSISGAVWLGLAGLNKHIQLGVVRKKVVIQTTATYYPAEWHGVHGEKLRF